MEIRSIHSDLIKKTYKLSDIVNVIECAMSGQNKEPYFYYDQRKNKTFEELYYGIKGFNKAMKGKKRFK